MIKNQITLFFLISISSIQFSLPSIAMMREDDDANEYVFVKSCTPKGFFKAIPVTTITISFNALPQERIDTVYPKGKTCFYYDAISNYDDDIYRRIRTTDFCSELASSVKDCLKEVDSVAVKFKGISRDDHLTVIKNSISILRKNIYSFDFQNDKDIKISVDPTLKEINYPRIDRDLLELAIKSLSKFEVTKDEKIEKADKKKKNKKEIKPEATQREIDIQRGTQRFLGANGSTFGMEGLGYFSSGEDE